MITLIGVIEGTVGEDGFMGLEMQAANAIKAKQFIQRSQNQVINVE